METWKRNVILVTFLYSLMGLAIGWLMDSLLRLWTGRNPIFITVCIVLGLTVIGALYAYFAFHPVGEKYEHSRNR